MIDGPSLGELGITSEAEKLDLDTPVVNLLQRRASDKTPTLDTPLSPMITLDEVEHETSRHSLIEKLNKRFKFHEKLGEGLTAVVFQALEGASNKRVVIKVLKKDTSQTTIRQFMTERENLSMLSRNQAKLGDGIVTTPELITPQIFWSDPEVLDETVIQTEAEGINLEQFLENGGTMTLKETLDTLDQALRVIEILNAEGKTHPDMKPISFMVKRTPSSSYSTKLTMIDWNHVGYLDPNLLESPPHSSDNPEFLFSSIDDVRTLACYAAMMYSNERIEAKAQSVFDMSKRLSGEVPDGLRLLIARALSPDVTYRFNTAEAFRKSVKHYRDLLNMTPHQLIESSKNLRKSINFSLREGSVDLDDYFNLTLHEAILRQDVLPKYDNPQRDVLIEVRTCKRYVAIPDKAYFEGKLLLAEGKDAGRASELFQAAYARTGGATIGRCIAVAEAAKVYPDILKKLNSHYLLEHITTTPKQAKQDLIARGLSEEYLEGVGLGCIPEEIAMREYFSDAGEMKRPFLQYAQSKLEALPYGRDVIAELGIVRRLQELKSQETIDIESGLVEMVFQKLIDQVSITNLPYLLWEIQGSQYRSKFAALFEKWMSSNENSSLLKVAQNLYNASLGKTNDFSHRFTYLVDEGVLQADKVNFQTAKSLRDNPMKIANLSKTLQEAVTKLKLTDTSDAIISHYLRAAIEHSLKKEDSADRLVTSARNYLRGEQFLEAEAKIDKAMTNGLSSSFLHELKMVTSCLINLQGDGQETRLLAHDLDDLMGVRAKGNIIDTQIKMELMKTTSESLKSLLSESGSLHVLSAGIKSDFRALLTDKTLSEY